MKLSFFETIDRTVNILEEMSPHYESVSDKLSAFFEALMHENIQPIVSVNRRVKSSKSLREKILRNKLYQKHETSEDILDNLPDLIGVMIFCRFVHEENDIFEIIKKFFSSTDVDGWYYNPELKNMPIYLNLAEPQPQKQKNGFSIYRVDGHYYSYGEKINFELQIKSLVHSFWSDIEHEIIYKNNSYLLIDSFMRDMLSSIHQNLESIDRQIALIYNQMNTVSNSQKNPDKVLNEEFSKLILAKSINDIFIEKMHENIGFTIDFKKACDILSQYIFVKNEIVYQNLSSQTMLELLTRINFISKRFIDFETPIYFEHKFKPKSRFGEILGSKLLEMINIDFEWNVFFKILFEIEPGSNIDDFERFLSIIKARYADADLYQPIFDKFSSSDASYIKDDVLTAIASALANAGTIKIIYEDNFLSVCAKIANFVLSIAESCSSIEEWEDFKNIELPQFEAIVSQSIS
ncbi:MAG: hypothetical protein KBF01_00710 [Proteocatella sp.]|nr:hypothetical protein [Proteocatella sp.]